MASRIPVTFIWDLDNCFLPVGYDLSTLVSNLETSIRRKDPKFYIDEVIPIGPKGSKWNRICREFPAAQPIASENSRCHGPCQGLIVHDIFKNKGKHNNGKKQNLARSSCLKSFLHATHYHSGNIGVGSIPLDGPSSILLQTCPLDQHNVHDDKFGLGISPIPLTKSLQGPSRPWSVCGSLAAVRNIPPLLGDTSGACSSLDELLYVDVGSSEGRYAQFSQTPSTLHQEEEVDGEDEISFSDVDAMIRKLNLIPDDSDSCLNREERNMSKYPRHTLLGSEHCTRTSVRRGIISQGAIAVLSCRDSKHFIRKHEVIIGRSSDGMNVDIDLDKDGYGSKIARRQALVKLEKNGSFSLKNLGKRHILVSGEKLNTGQIVSLTSCSSVDIRGIVFEFKINNEAVRHFLKNNSRRNSEDDNKFRWCE